MATNQGPPVNGPKPKPEKYLKVSLYLRKLPNVSDEYFHGYWRNNHLVPAFANTTFMSKVRKYNQVLFCSSHFLSLRVAPRIYWIRYVNINDIAPHHPRLAGTGSGPGYPRPRL